MTRPIAVLRPEPGNRVTAAAIEARGRRAIRLPLFAVAPVAWHPPAPGDFDALVVTSANAVRHGGAGLAALLELPVYAVGEATAQAARTAGFDVVATGSAGAAALLETARAQGVARAIHLAGQARTIEPGGIVAEVHTVYASTALAVADDAVRRIAGAVVLVQSARAGRRLAELVDSLGIDRAQIAIVAISAAAAAAAGDGWGTIAIPPAPDSAQLLDRACALAD